uniref:G2/M-phase specific E3 ubiquitin protein ligase n=1 Tax=Kryptolebias marmoratus TaxID=37003 RepID=A0A3Q3AKH1_KRYMA
MLPQLTSCGVYQRGEEDEGVFGFLVEDIKQEIRRSARLMCFSCKRKGACVGCNVRSCRKMAHFPCSRKMKFVSQFTGLFPSYCPAHSPSQSLSVGSDFSLPQSCSVCLDSIDPVLSYSILKCPSCHASWFHRDCVQRQAQSAGLFFFRCTLCNNKEDFQKEMLRMGIYIPERDASWELEANAYSELLEVYECCDSLTCLCSNGRTYSAKTGWFEVIRCRLCGSTGTHRKCSGLKLDTTDWACIDCTNATDGKGLTDHCILGYVTSGRSEERSPVQTVPLIGSVSFRACLPALSAGLDLVRRTDFDPTHALSVRFKDEQHTAFSSSHEDASRKYFLKLLVQQIQDSVVFEGPNGSKYLTLDSQALRDDLYFDIGCLLALSLVYGGPRVGFFSHALYQCLFNYPANCPLNITAAASWEYLELAGCNRPISSLEDREALVEDLITCRCVLLFLSDTRRKEEFDLLQVQLFPSVFFSVFCQAAENVTAQTLSCLFTVTAAGNTLPSSSSVGKSSITLQDIVRFSTGAGELPAHGLVPSPSVSFLHGPTEEPRDEGLFPQSKPESNTLLLPVTSSYKAFKSSMEHAISHHSHLLPSELE